MAYRLDLVMCIDHLNVCSGQGTAYLVPVRLSTGRQRPGVALPRSRSRIAAARTWRQMGIWNLHSLLSERASEAQSARQL
jgi:hypothetical protein